MIGQVFYIPENLRAMFFYKRLPIPNLDYFFVIKGYATETDPDKSTYGQEKKDTYSISFLTKEGGKFGIATRHSDSNWLMNRAKSVSDLPQETQDKCQEEIIYLQTKATIHILRSI